jgi:hypothetical protein
MHPQLTSIIFPAHMSVWQLGLSFALKFHTSWILQALSCSFLCTLCVVDCGICNWWMAQQMDLWELSWKFSQIISTQSKSTAWLPLPFLLIIKPILSNSLCHATMLCHSGGSCPHSHLYFPCTVTRNLNSGSQKQYYTFCCITNCIL